MADDGKIQLSQLSPYLKALILGAAEAAGIGAGAGAYMLAYNFYTTTIIADTDTVYFNMDYEEDSNNLIVFKNSVFLSPGVDYRIQGNDIVSLKGKWKSGTTFSFNLFGSKPGPSATKLVCYKKSYTIKMLTTRIPIGIDNFNPTNDTLLVWKNGVYQHEGQDYTLDEMYIYSKTQNDWQASEDQQVNFSFIVLKNALNPNALEGLTGENIEDGSLSIDKMDDDFKKRFEDLENLKAKDIPIDAISGMRATNVQKALEEVFQSASNGKNTIANAITGKGVPSNGSMTYQQLATNISNITTNDSDIYYKLEWSGSYKDVYININNANPNFKYDEATKILTWNGLNGISRLGIDLNMGKNFNIKSYNENQFPNSVSLKSPVNRIVEYDTSFTYGVGTSAANTIKLKACNYIYIYIGNNKYFELYKSLQYRPGYIHILNLPNKDIIVWSLDVETRDDNALKTANVLHINYYSYHRNTIKYTKDEIINNGIVAKYVAEKVSEQKLDLNRYSKSYLIEGMQELYYKNSNESQPKTTHFKWHKDNHNNIIVYYDYNWYAQDGTFVVGWYQYIDLSTFKVTSSGTSNLNNSDVRIGRVYQNTSNNSYSKYGTIVTENHQKTNPDGSNRYYDSCVIKLQTSNMVYELLKLNNRGFVFDNTDETFTTIVEKLDENGVKMPYKTKYKIVMRLVDKHGNILE